MVGTAEVILKPGREKSLLRRHPWIFNNAIAKFSNALTLGATVEVRAHDRRWLARGAWSPHSQIQVRAWTFAADELIDADFFRRRLQRALAARAALSLDGDACRLVNGESDGLPGLVIDRYGEFLVCQFSTAGADAWREVLIAQLQALIPSTGIYERSDLDIRDKEGLAPRSGVLAGAEPPEIIPIRESTQRFWVDVRNGHKTGFYLDQRDSRALLARYCRDAEVLNGFSYTGAFTVAALSAGARRVTNIDSSARALALGQQNLALNGLDPARVEDIAGNAFQALRQLRAEGRQFDAVILDPPKFVDSRAALARASRGYKDINLLACQLLRPGGWLATFSCSGLLAPDLFQKIVADAALDAGRDAQLVARLGQAADHPTLLSFPEGSYLKGLLCRVVS